MSLKSKFFTFLTVASAVVGLATFTLAQQSPATPSTGKAEKRKGEGRGFGKRKFHGEGRGEGRGGKMHGFRGIELTDAQKEQMRVIRENNKPDATTIAELKAFREVRKAGTAITPEQKARMKAFRGQMRTKREAVHAQMLAVLTPEQRAQIERKKQEMQQRPEEWKQKRQPATDKPKIS